MDPTLRPRIIAMLKDEIGHFAPQLRVAAKYVIDHPAEFGLDPIRSTAQKAGVSTYTIVKMAKYLGFDSFETFRAPFRQALLADTATPSSPTWLDAQRDAGPLGPAFADAAKNTLSITQFSMENQQTDSLETIVEALFTAQKTYVTATRVSFSVAYYLHYVGRFALPRLELIPRSMNAAIDDLRDAGPDDLLIAITLAPYSRETLDACRFARSKGLTILMISDSEVAEPGIEPDFTLVSKATSTHHFTCLSGVMAVVETLVALLIHRAGPAAHDRIVASESLRAASNLP